LEARLAAAYLPQAALGILGVDALQSLASQVVASAHDAH
jgi:hypothetical protein